MRHFANTATLVFISTIAASADADGGYFSGTKGARAAGRAGAFVARADDLSAVLYNPAGLTRIGGTVIQLGNRFSYNAHAFERAPTLDWGNLDAGIPPYVEFAAVENREPWQLLEPMLGVTSSLGLRDWAFALTIHAPAGIGRQAFPIDGGQRYMMVSREARILNYSGSVAWKSGEVFGVGASIQWIDVPALRYQLVIDANRFPGEVNPVRSEFDMLATVDGADPFTFNAIAGAWYRPVRHLEVAVAVQFIPTSIETDSTLTIEPLNSEIDDDVELTRDGSPADDVRLTLPLPITARAAVRYRHLQGDTELWDLELDVGYESWSRVERFTMDGDGLVANLLGQRVNVNSIEIQKHWRDVWSVRAGGDYRAIPEWLTLRAGVFYETAVADSRYAHVDFVSGPQLGAALGASVRVWDSEVAFAYEYRHQPALSVRESGAGVFQEVPGSECPAPYTDSDLCHPEFLGRRSPPVNAGSFRSHSHAISLDVLHRF